MEPLTALALGGAALWVLTRKKKPPASVVRASSGRSWLTRVQSSSFIGGVKHTVISVYAPPGSFGQPGEVLVATYKQIGSDTASRTAIATGPAATSQMITAAGKDFGIKKPKAQAA